MGLRLNNSYFRLNGGSYRSGILTNTGAVSTGTIFRLTNFNGPSAFSVNYTNINNQTVSTGNISLGQVVYILAKSGSISDNYDQFTGELIASLGINTIDPNENLNFTEQLFTTTGVGSWTKPVGITQVIVQCLGAGGGGGGATLNGEGGCGGGGGAYAKSILSYNSAEQSISYSIGSGGIGSTGTGGTGEDTTWNTSTVIAKGSTGGEANAFGQPGATIVGSIGDYTNNGETGGTSFSDGFGNIGQGSGGSSGGVAIIVYQSYLAVDIAGSFVEGVFTTTNTNGSNGNIYGGGATPGVKFSGPARSGGNGAQGLIRLIYR